MVMTNVAIMERARGMLKGAWTLPILASAVYLSIYFLLGCIPAIGWIINILIAGPLRLGYAIAYLAFTRGREMRLSLLFEGFHRFVNAFLAYILSTIFIMLWSLLLLVPGIIAALSYSQTFYILADNPGMEGLAAITKSKEMMDGYKWQLFCLELRFIGWFLLGFITLGIGLLWVIPYFQTSLTIFYEDLKRASGAASPAGGLPPLEPAPGQ